MSEQNAGVSPTASAGTPPPDSNAYRTLVAQVSATITGAVMQIPGYEADLSDVPKSLRRTVSSEFLGMTAAAVDASSELQGVKELDAAECRDTMRSPTPSTC
jgi:hypothetical protein